MKIRAIGAAWLLIIAAFLGAWTHGASTGTIAPSVAWTGTLNSGGTTPVASATPHGQINITGAANNGSGLIRLTLSSTTGLATGQQRQVASIAGTTEANGQWTITLVDSTHVDLQASTFTNAYTSGGTIYYPGIAVGNFDSWPNIWVEIGGCNAITVGAGTGDRSWIKEVDFWLEGTTASVATQSINPCTSSQGWMITPQSRAGQNGEAQFCATIVPVNGYERVVCMPLTLNTDAGTLISRPAFYVDAVNGSDLNDGTAIATGGGHGPWKSFQKSIVGVSGQSHGSAIIYYAGSSYLGSPATYIWEPPTTIAGTNANTRTIDIRPYLPGDTATISRVFKLTQDYITNASTTSGAVLLFASTAGLFAGDQVVGTNIPATTFISTITPTTVTLTKSVTGTVAGGAAITFTHVYPFLMQANLVTLSGLTYDMSKIVSFGILTNGVIHNRDCSIVDPNGPLGPQYSWSGLEAGDGIGSNGLLGQFQSISECTYSTQAIGTLNLIRNTSGVIAFDANFIGGGEVTNLSAGGNLSNGGTRSFNAKYLAPRTMWSRVTTPNTVTLGSAAFSSPTTTLIWSGSPIIGSLTQCNVSFLSGALSSPVSATANNGSGAIRVTVGNTSGFATGQTSLLSGINTNISTQLYSPTNGMWLITVVDGTHIDLQGSSYSASDAYVSGGVLGRSFFCTLQTPGTFTTIVTGDASGASPGDIAFINTPNHSDMMQFANAIASNEINNSNMYFQRFQCSCDEQLVLIQRSGYVGIGTLSTSGTTATITPPTLNIGSVGAFSGGHTVVTWGPTSINTSGSTASGKVLPFAATTGVDVGYTVTGTNIPASTTVASYTPTSVTLNNNISGTVGSGAAIAFAPVLLAPRGPAFGYQMPASSVVKFTSGALSGQSFPVFSGTSTATTVVGDASAGGGATAQPAIYLMPNDFLVVQNGPPYNTYRRVLSYDTPTTATLISPFPTNQSGVIWKQAKGVEGWGAVNSIFNHNPVISNAAEGQATNGPSNYFYAQSDLVGANYQFRADATTFSMDTFGIFDSLLHSSCGAGGADGSPLSPGYYFDTNQFELVHCFGPYSYGQNFVINPFTLDPITLAPLSGVTKTMAGNPLTGAPLVPWDYYNNPITNSSLVGAVQP